MGQRQLQQTQNDKNKKIQYYIQRGNTVLDEKYIKQWVAYVPVRVQSDTKGAELGIAINVIQALNEGKSFAECKEMLDVSMEVHCSKMLIYSIIRNFCDKGKDFIVLRRCYDGAVVYDVNDVKNF